MIRISLLDIIQIQNFVSMELRLRMKMDSKYINCLNYDKEVKDQIDVMKLGSDKVHYLKRTHFWFQIAKLKMCINVINSEVYFGSPVA